MNRRYDLDWLRVIAFAILMLFHTGMMFSSYEWHVKNFETSPLIDHAIRFLHQWRMPLLFFISGAAVWFAMEKYSLGRYLRERQTRLLLPLVFGMLVVIPPQVYCERLYQRQAYASFLDFYPTIFTSGSYPQGNLSWHHLWYVPYIWAFSMITFPAFAWIRSTSGRRFLARFHALLASPWALFALFIPSALAEIALRPFFPGDSCNLISDWGNFTHKLTFFIIGFMLASAPSVADVIVIHRRKFLAAAIISLAILEPFWIFPTRLQSISLLGYRCLSNFHIWMWILAALGFGRHYLNFNHRFLRYATEAVYPFYILHQTVIVILALALVYIDLGLWTKYFIVLIGMTLITWFLYELVITRINILRVCFGMKPKRRPEKASAAAHQAGQPGTAGGSGSILSSGPAATFTLLTLVLMAAAATPSAWAKSGTLTPVTIHSAALQGNLLQVSDTQPAAVYLPPSYSTGQKRYPVIYFLPNFNTLIWRYTGGSYQGFKMRESADTLIKQGAMPETIIVIPNTVHVLGSSWYRNSHLTGNWEDYIVRDVVNYIDSHFRTIDSQFARGLAGHGVGGTGALELALKHPGVFGSVYAMSPAILDADGIQEFTVAGDAQSPGWDRLLAQWNRAPQAGASKGFTMYMQDRLYNPSRQAQFDGLRISYLAAARPDFAAPFPHIVFPAPKVVSETDRHQAWSEIMGDWDAKLRAYVAQDARLASITIEYGKRDEYQFIRRGAEHVSRLMQSMGISNTLTVSEGGHDSTLGRRLQTAMLPRLATVLRGTE